MADRLTRFIDKEQRMKRVLIAEDNPDLRFIFSTVFDQEGFETTTVFDGRDAIRVLSESLPDILVLDVNMPHISGLEVLSFIHKHEGSQSLKVILVTSDPNAQYLKEASYADLFLVKPVSVPALVTLARRLLHE
jgi:CheY-like chemotaxis protein